MKALALAAAGALFALGCDHHEESGPPPTIAIEVTPTTVDQGGTVQLNVTVENFTLQNPDDAHEEHPMSRPLHTEPGASTAKSGHYHVYLDSMDEEPILMAWDAQMDVAIDAEPGNHELFVRLNDDSHRIIEPQVYDSVAITVEAGAGGAGAGGGAGGN